MAAISTKGLKIYLSGLISTFTSIAPTGVTLAKPAVVTLPDVTGILAGQVVKIAAGATGFPELDGKLFVVGTVSAGPKTISLLGSDTTGSTGVLSGTPAILTVPDTAMTALTCTLGEFTINTETAGTIDIGTYCDISAQTIDTNVKGGTVNIKGQMDITSTGYNTLLTANDDYAERILKVDLPSNGYLIGPAIVSSMSFEIPLNGVQGFSGTFLMTSRWKHLF